VCMHNFAYAIKQIVGEVNVSVIKPLRRLSVKAFKKIVSLMLVTKIWYLCPGYWG